VVRDKTARYNPTFQRLHGLALCSFLSDASEHRLQQLPYVWLNLFVGVARHENVCIGSKALCAAFGSATLQICDLLYAYVELGFPLLFRNMHIFAIENLVDGVGAVVKALA